MIEIDTASDYLDLLSRLDTFLTTNGSAFGLSYVGTGNGTLTGYKGGSASVAETFTITATSSTNFTVVGSVSGSLSAATVGTPYTGTKVQFLITAGGTAFVSGDVFTLSTAPKWGSARRAIGAVCTASVGTTGSTHPNEAIGMRDGHSWGGNGAAPYTFTATFFEAETIVEYAIGCRASGYLGSEPKTWTLEYWNGSSWVVLDTQTNITNWGPGVTNVYPISSPVSATQYRLNISVSLSPGGIGMVHFSLRRSTNGFNAANGQCIWKAPGNDGAGEFYCGVHPMERDDADWFDWEALSLDGFTSTAELEAQPGLYRNVFTPLWNASIPYWFIANGRRVIVIAKLGTQYEALYLGCYNPYFTPGQLPYPVMVGGSFFSGSADYDSQNFNSTDFRFSNSTANHKAFPIADDNGGGNVNYRGQLRARRQDGSWQSFTAAHNSVPSAISAYQYSFLWPYCGGGAQLDTNIDGSYALLPIMLCDITPNNFGELDGVVAITGQGASAESTIQVGMDIYMMVPNISRTGREDFFAVRLD